MDAFVNAGQEQGFSEVTLGQEDILLLGVHAFIVVQFLVFLHVFERISALCVCGKSRILSNNRWFFFFKGQAHFAVAGIWFLFCPSSSFCPSNPVWTSGCSRQQRWSRNIQWQWLAAAKLLMIGAYIWNIAVIDVYFILGSHNHHCIDLINCAALLHPPSLWSIHFCSFDIFAGILKFPRCWSWGTGLNFSVLDWLNLTSIFNFTGKVCQTIPEIVWSNARVDKCIIQCDWEDYPHLTTRDNRVVQLHRSTKLNHKPKQDCN